MSKAVVGDLIEVNKVVSQVHDHSNTEIKILPIPIQNLEIGVWSDASFANAEAHKSHGGYIVCAVENEKGLKENKWSKVSPWRWRSFKQDRQTASTLGAELLTMSRAVAEAKWLRSMWTEMTCPSYTLESDRELTKQSAIVLSIDSRPAYDHLHGQVMTIKDKRLAIEMLLMKQDIGSENVLEQAHCIACHSPPIHPSLGNETRSSRHLLTNGGKVAGTQTAGKDNRGRVGCNLTQTALHKHTTTGLHAQVTKCTCPKKHTRTKRVRAGGRKVHKDT